ncbi:MAG: Stk1 family PASTA domain-containing Ser/Thr kinase [Ruminococcus sp.]|nr:Stk1 family PASTA domain-containing Ser/Thr kinase [Ruminococcus sp.]
MDKYVGKKLDGRYEIRELIGIGGMANVYRCYDTVDDREVAIKILKDEYLNNEEFIRRFKNESKAIAVLSHPNIVKVYDVSFGDMIQYIVMEYIDGITLKEYINQQRTLTWKETVHLITQILKALSHAHSKGVVHRDIKPQNMMLLSDGTIKVTDFGIARFSNSTRTMTEQAIGSVHYIAPEQAKGDITDGKTDIYSVGVMMYEMLTGRLPFDGDNAVSVALMHLQIVPDAPRSINPDIPEGIEEITLKAMQKQPMDRYQSANDMIADIERFRMNPSVRFEYKYLSENQQTRYMDAVNKGKISRAEEFSQGSKNNDDDNVRHSLAFSIIIGILIAAFISVAVCVPYGIFKASQQNEVQDVDVPNFIGMTEEQIRSNKEYSSFDLRYDYVNSDSYDIGEVIDQQPKPNSKKIKATGTITLKVNSVMSEEEIPVIAGVSEADARRILAQAGFTKVESIYVSSSSYEDNTVVQSYPEQGITVSISNTVYLYIAGEEKTELSKLPCVVGEDIETAKVILKDAGFEVEAEAKDSTAPKDQVYYQSPLGGKLRKGSTVTLYYSKGADVELSFTLPTDTSYYPLTVTYIINGESKTETVESYTKNIKILVSGEGEVPVEVYINDMLCLKCTVDTGTGGVEIIEKYTYKPSQQETTAPTETLS